MARRRKRRITKRELKEDRFVETATELLHFLKSHSVKLVWALVGLLVVLLSVRYVAQTRSRAKDDALFAFTLANSFFFTGKYQDAIPKYEEILDKYPSTPSGIKSSYYLGNLHYLLGEYDVALDHYERYLDKSKDPILAPAALEGIGACYEQRGDLEEAARRYETVFERYPRSVISARALLSAARCHESLGNYEPAEDLYQKIIKEFPKSWKAEEAEAKLAFLKGMEAATAR